MVGNLLHKYLWLVDTIYRSDGITFEQLNARWLKSDLSEGLELPKRTFHKWRVAVEELFGLIIDCERKNGYRFFIRNKEILRGDSLSGWLFNTLSTGYKLERHKTIKDRIVLEDVFTGDDLLSTILDSLHSNTRLVVTYKRFGGDAESTFEVEPYCLRMFRQRWYLVARSISFPQPRIYALDRIVSVEPTAEVFTYPEEFSAERYFAPWYGVIVDDSMEAEAVELKVHDSHVGYLRTLPLHKSQQEVEQTAEYSVFRLTLAPTFDFEQAILGLGEYVEVLSPRWFRERIASRVNQMKEQYKDITQGVPKP